MQRNENYSLQGEIFLLFFYCFTVPAKAGNVLSSSVLSPGAKEVGIFRRLQRRRQVLKGWGRTWIGEGEDLI